VSVKNGEGEWSALGWQRCSTPTFKDFKNFIVEVTISGEAEAAGLSFGPYTDFLSALDAKAGARHLQVDSAVGLSAGAIKAYPLACLKC
jgi:hypothetical protein